MLPTKIELHNFTSYQDESADISALNIAPLVGANGAGKSSLIDGMLIALFGEATKGGEKELDNYQPITGEAEGSAAVEFLLHGHLYRVERARNYAKKKSSLKLLMSTEEGWKNIGDKGVRETQKKIQELIRVDYKTFINSSIILQKDSESFTTATDGERKEILAQILGLDIWDQLIGKVRKTLSEIQGSLKSSEMEREKLFEIVKCREQFLDRQTTSKITLKESKEKIASLESDITALTEQLAARPALEQQISAMKVQVNDEKRRIVDMEDRASATKKSLGHQEQKLKEQQQILTREAEIEQAIEVEADIAAQVKAWDGKQKTSQELQAKLWKLTSEQERWDKTQATERVRIETGLRQAQAQSELLDQVPCDPETGKQCKLLSQAWSAREKIAGMQQILNSLSENTSPYAADMDEVQMDIDHTGYNALIHDTAKKELVEVQKVARLKEALSAAQERSIELQQQIDQGQSEIENLERVILSATKKIGEITASNQDIQEKLNSLSPASFDLSNKKIELKKQRDSEAVIIAEQGKIANSLEQIEKAEEQIVKIDDSTKEAREKVGLYSLLEKACDRKGGVPAFIIEAALPQVEAMANQFLAGIAGGRFQIRFETQPEVKSTGELGEGCRPVVMDSGRERAYITYSGAESFIINFAIRIGIGLFLAHRAGAEIKLLVLDEGLGALDASNRQAVIEAIQKAAEHFGRVLLITHIPELQDAFPQRIEVSKDGSGSKVKIVA